MRVCVSESEREIPTCALRVVLGCGPVHPSQHACCVLAVCWLRSLNTALSSIVPQQRPAGGALRHILLGGAVSSAAVAAALKRRPMRFFAVL